MSVNKCILVGNLGADPETRSSSGGMTICNLRIATNERKKEGNDWVDHTEWHRVVCFGTTAENAAKHLQKGRQVYIEGKIRTNKWQDKDGVDKYTTEILADNVTFLGGAPGGGDRGRDDDRGGRRDDRRDDRNDRGRDDRGGRNDSGRGNGARSDW